MIKRAKFREDSVLSYQRHNQAVRKYLSAVPQPPPAFRPATAPRKRREKSFYRRLALAARAFPLVIAVAGFGVLWGGEHSEKNRQHAMHAPQTGEKIPMAVAMGEVIPMAVAVIHLPSSPHTPSDASVAQASEPPPERRFRSSHAVLPSLAILEMGRMVLQSDDNSSMAK